MIDRERLNAQVAASGYKKKYLAHSAGDERRHPAEQAAGQKRVQTAGGPEAELPAWV